MRATTAPAFLAAVLCLAAPAAPAGERMHYFELINRAHDRVASVSAAPAGTQDWRELLRDGDLRGGGEAVTVHIEAGPCLRDVRVAFADGRRALYPGVDVCRHRGLRIRPLPAAGGDAPVLAAPAGDAADTRLGRSE